MTNYQPLLFNYNIPAEIFAVNMPDKFLEVRCHYTYTGGDGKANAAIEIISMPPHYGHMVKDWERVDREIRDIAIQHFQRLVDLDKRLQAEDTLRRLAGEGIAELEPITHSKEMRA